MSVIEIEREAPIEISPCEEATLEWVNEIRERYNIGPELEMLPVGFPKSASECPVANALHATLATKTAIQINHWAGHSELLVPPTQVREFMTAFDDEQYEHLQDPEYVRLTRDG